MNKRGLYSSSEFSKKLLPKNRREVFFDVFKMHFFSFVKMGLIFFFFSLPLLSLYFIKDYSYIVAFENDVSNSMALIICTALEFIGVMILSIPIAGFGKIYHEYAWLEPVFFLNDFKEGIKENIVPTLKSMFILSLNIVAFDFAYLFSPSGWLMAIPFGVGVTFVLPVVLHVIFINFIYTNKYMVNFKLGCFFYLKHIISTFLCLLPLLAPKVYTLFIMSNIIALLTKYGVLLVYIIFLVPFIFLAIQLNEMRIFDIHINIQRFPHLVDKGMYKEEQDQNEEF